MPILPNHIKTPAVLTPRGFVPSGGFEYKPLTGESWVSLASAAGVLPWDLIRFNFPSLPADRREAAKEVNWYLQNHLGCTALTGDSRNFRFSSSDTPGKIYLPNSVVQTSMARNRIIQILTNPYTSQIRFMAAYWMITGAHYAAVADAIRNGKIQVVFDPASGHMAYYDYPSAGGFTGKLTVGPHTDEGLIVHEATHAIFDYLKATIANNRNEGISYIAQHAYSRLKHGPPTTRYIVSRDPSDPFSEIAWQTIFDEASRLAGIAVNDHVISASECALLFNILPMANVYRAKGTTEYTYDGI